MKIASIILSVIALGLIAFNITKINFNSPFEGESTIAFIEIIAALIAIILLAIFTVSKRIEQKINQ
jgi:integral membrane sensor domain MASE1